MADSPREMTNDALCRMQRANARLKNLRAPMLNAARYADRCSLTGSLDSIRLELSALTELLRDIRASLPTDS